MLQKQLLRFRFEKMKTLALAETQGERQLHSLSRDLYQALALPTAEDAETCQWLVEYLEDQEGSNRVPLSLVQSAVLRTFFKRVHGCTEGQTQIKDLAAEGNAD